VKELRPESSVIMITAYGDIDLAVKSLKEGASDFILKPWQNEKLLAAINEALKNKKDSGQKTSMEKENNSVIGNELIGRSEVMEGIFYKIEKIAPTDANILLLGENGTGKDLIAKAIHQHSNR